jgi:predicted RNase H-like HicB family nuclease
MKMDDIRYAAVIEQSLDGYGVFFPDLPGCTSGGYDLEHAIANAGEALAMHIEGMIEDGQSLPKSTSLDKLTIEPDCEVHAIALIKADGPNRKVCINVTMDAKLLTAIDRVASNRSQFLSQAARDALTVA